MGFALQIHNDAKETFIDINISHRVQIMQFNSARDSDETNSSYYSNNSLSSSRIRVDDQHRRHAKVNDYNTTSRHVGRSMENNLQASNRSNYQTPAYDTESFSSENCEPNNFIPTQTFMNSSNPYIQLKPANSQENKINNNFQPPPLQCQSTNFVNQQYSTNQLKYPVNQLQYPVNQLQYPINQLQYPVHQLYPTNLQYYPSIQQPIMNHADPICLQRANTADGYYHPSQYAKPNTNVYGNCMSNAALQNIKMQASQHNYCAVQPQSMQYFQEPPQSNPVAPQMLNVQTNMQSLQSHLMSNVDLQKGMSNFSQINLLPRDIADLINDYDPSSRECISVRRWILSVEQIQTLYNVNDKVILFASIKKLKGIAANFYESVASKILSWNQLRESLIKEFDVSRDVTDVHTALRSSTVK